jgi:sugar O-acyltransferase (sialic acid O-acetyltransferase NeuD family)
VKHSNGCGIPWRRLELRQASASPPSANCYAREKGEAEVRIAIFGCGGFGREVLRLAQELDERFDAEPVFVADQPRSPVLDRPVITPDQLEPGDELVIAVGSPGDRRAIAERLNRPCRSLIARSSIVGPDVTIGEGAILCDYTIITASAQIGRQFQCNIYSYVAHDCVIGDFVTFAPRVCCNGNVHVEDGAYVGTGAVIK